MSIFMLSSLNLTNEETQALMAAGEEAFPEFLSIVGKYDAEKSERTDEKLRVLVESGAIHENEASKLAAIRRLKYANPTSFKPAAFLPRKNDGYFCEHESFGQVHRTHFQSNEPSFVGSPTLSHGGISIKFGHAEFKTSEMRKDEAALSETTSLISIDLSAEQFSGLLRNAHSSSPCRISSNGAGYLDKPPRMLTSINIANTARAEANAIGADLLAACDELQKYMSGDHKISKKDDISHMVQLAESVQVAMDEMVKPMSDMLLRTAGLMAESSSKQLISEITEPLKALGMNGSDLYLRLT